MSRISRGLVAATVLLALTSASFAATTKIVPQVYKVSLLGEAGQPMSVVLPATTLKAGSVEFQVSNDAIGTDHAQHRAPGL